MTIQSAFITALATVVAALIAIVAPHFNWKSSLLKDMEIIERASNLATSSEEQGKAKSKIVVCMGLLLYFLRWRLLQYRLNAYMRHTLVGPIRHVSISLSCCLLRMFID